MIVIEIITFDLNVEEIDTFWVCWLKITNTPDSYMLPATAPGILIESELQSHFDNNATELWALANIKQYPIDTGDSGANEARGGAKVWYQNNPAAKLLFTLDPIDLETEIDSMIEDLFPSASVANKKRMRLLLTSFAYNDRIVMRRLGLV